jgi:hypothetical protein
MWLWLPREQSKSTKTQDGSHSPEVAGVTSHYCPTLSVTWTNPCAVWTTRGWAPGGCLLRRPAFPNCSFLTWCKKFSGYKKMLFCWKHFSLDICVLKGRWFLAFPLQWLILLDCIVISYGAFCLPSICLISHPSPTGQQYHSVTNLWRQFLDLNSSSIVSFCISYLADSCQDHCNRFWGFWVL